MKIKLDKETAPSFCEEGLRRFEELITHANSYVEYGMGGSTFKALASGVDRIFSVESDGLFSSEIKKIFFDNPSFIVSHVDIGPTKEWGYPVDDRGITDYHKYALAPWEGSYESSDVDLVLIDGRFRVACLLASFLFTAPSTIILFDDYFDRKPYHVVEKICAPTLRHGRMAEFRTPSFILDKFLLIKMLLEYSIVTA